MVKNIDYSRYLSHINIKEVGIEGQIKLSNAKILIIGLGGLGCINALYLSSSGIGTLGIMDDDKVELSNISRQVIYSLNDVGKPKVKVASKFLSHINKDTKIISIEKRLSIKNIKKTFNGYDIIIDCSDNLPTKFLINDFSHYYNKPFIYGSIFQFQGYASIFLPNKTCYRCMQIKAPIQQIQDCSSSGVLSTVVGIIGLIQATEAIKYILGIPTISGRLLYLDAKIMEFRMIKLKKNNDCSICKGDKPKVLVEEIGENKSCESDSIDPKSLAKLIDANSNICILDVREPYETKICKIKKSINIPLAELKKGLHNLDKDRKIVVYCHHGSRSKIACKILDEEGFDAINLEGGIDNWAGEVQLNMKRY